MHAQAGQPGERFALRAQLRTVPLVVWALVGLQVSVLLAYTVLMPVYRAPDEPQNFDIALATRDFPQFTGHHRAIDPMVTRSYPFAQFSMKTRRAPVDVEPPAPRGRRPSFSALSEPPGLSFARNQQWQHPPLYPAVVGAAITVVTTLYPPAYDWAFDQVVGFARFVSVLLVGPLPLLAFLVARRLTADETVALTAAVVPLTIPQLAHIGAAVSHDTLLVLLVGLVTVPVAFVLRGDGSARTATAVGALSGLALLTKGFALFLPLWLAGVYGLAALRWRRWRLLAAGALAVGLAAGVGGWWWARNLAVYGTVQPTGVPLPPPEAGFTPDVEWWAGWLAQVLPWRFWGHLGWYQAPLPGWVVVAATAVLLTAVVLAVAWRRAGGPARADLLALGFPTLAIAGIVVYGGWAYYVETSFALGLQGRYLFPGLAGLAVLVGAGLGVLPSRAARWAPPGVLIAAVVLHAVAVRVILRHVYGAGTQVSWGGAAGAVAAWSPWPVGALAVTLLAVVGLLGAAGFLLVAQARRRRPLVVAGHTPHLLDGQDLAMAADAHSDGHADGHDGRGAQRTAADLSEEAGQSP